MKASVCVLNTVKLFLLITPFNYYYCQCEVFSSSHRLSKLLKFEKKIVHQVENLLNGIEPQLLGVLEYLKDYDNTVHRGRNSSTEDDHSSSLQENPLQLYKLLKRFHLILAKVEQLSPKFGWEKISDILKAEESQILSFSSQVDLTGAAEGLIRLQSVYGISSKDLIEGLVTPGGDETAPSMDTEDCLSIGKFSYGKGLHQISFEWLKELTRLAKLGDRGLVSLELAEMYSNKAHELYDQHFVKKGEEENEKTENATNNERLKSLQNNPLIRTHITPEDQKIFEALCRGEVFLSSDYLSTLVCTYDSLSSPYLVLSPVKVEVLHWNPPVKMFHDVITESEISMLKQVAESNKLERGEVWNFECMCNVVSDDKIMMNANLFLDEVDSFKDLKHRMLYLTQAASSNPFYEEPLYIENYGIAGHYGIHISRLQGRGEEFLNPDFRLTEEDLEEGDRLKSLTMFMSNVLGGAKALPRLGVTVTPRKGSAVLWYNLKRSGQTNHFSLYGSCPVLHGSKWVSTWHLRDREEFLSSPCGLRSDE